MSVQLQSIIIKSWRMPWAALAIALTCIGALGFAFTMQFGFGYQPCILCLWQRVPFGLGAMLALAALATRPYGRPTQAVLALCSLIFLVGTGLAAFHTGVEQHWWAGTDQCQGSALQATTPEELRAELLRTQIARCDKIDWTLFGLSMANWNIAFSFLLALFAGKAALSASLPPVFKEGEHHA